MKDENIQAIMDYIESSKKLLDKERELAKLLGGFDGELQQAMLVMENIARKLLEEKVGDKTESITWFVFECNCGRDPKKAGVGNNMREIASIDDLVWLIDLENQLPITE